MTDVGRAELRLPLCNDVFQAEMAAADRRLRGHVREGRPGFAESRLRICKWCLEPCLTFMNEGCVEG